MGNNVNAEDFMVYKYNQGQDPEFEEVISSRGVSWEVNLNIRREDLEMDYKKDPESAKMRYESLTGDTLVWTADGALRIDEVREGAVIGTALGNREVQMFIESGKKDVYEVVTKEGYVIKGSANHPMKVYANKKNWKESSGFVWRTIGELRKGDKIYLELNNSLFGHGTMSKDMALLMGGLLADGTFQQRPDGRYYATWYFGKNKELAEIYMSAFEREFGKQIQVNNPPSRNDYSMRTDNQEIISKFLDYGLEPGDARSKVIPSSVFQQPREVIQEFIKAYVDADGHVLKRHGTIQITSCNINMLRQLQQLLLMLGIRSRIINPEKPREYRIKGKQGVSGRAYKLIMSKAESLEFNRQIELNVSYKRENQKVLTLDSIREDRRYQLPYVEVKSVVYVGNEECYDLWVEPDNEFIANGMGVHNCIPPKQRGGFFQYPERIDDCVKVGKVNPCVLEETIITKTLDDGQERHFIGYNVELFRDTLELDQSKTYYLGLDGGIEKDMYTLSLFHAETFYDEVVEGGEAVLKPRNKPVEDLLIQWKPDTKNKIPVSVQNVIDIVEVMCERVYVKKALMDKFNSGAMVQKLMEFGVEAEDKVFSNPFQLAIYTQFKNLAYTGHLELLDLEEPNDNMKHILLVNGSKIDHEKDREKDTCDARVTSVYLCATDDPEEITNFAIPAIAGAVRAR